jgi:hypothetical protein
MSESSGTRNLTLKKQSCSKAEVCYFCSEERKDSPCPTIDVMAAAYGNRV